MSVTMKRQLLLLPGLVLALSLGAAPGQDKAETKYSGPTLKAWIADLKDDDVLVREEAIEVLAQVGAPAKGAAKELQKLLKDKNRSIRSRAALALWKVGGDAKPAVSVLSESLKEATAAVRKD